jgi:hypothetical protein
LFEVKKQKIQPSNQIEAAKGNAKRDSILFRLAIYIPRKTMRCFSGLSFLRTALLLFVNSTSQETRKNTYGWKHFSRGFSIKHKQKLKPAGDSANT